MAGFANLREVMAAQDAGKHLYASSVPRRLPRPAFGSTYPCRLGTRRRTTTLAPWAFTPLKQSTDGGLRHGGNVAAAEVFAQADGAHGDGDAAPLTMLLLDYIGFYPFVDETVTDEQFLDNTQCHACRRR